MAAPGSSPSSRQIWRSLAERRPQEDTFDVLVHFGDVVHAPEVGSIVTHGVTVNSAMYTIQKLSQVPWCRIHVHCTPSMCSPVSAT
jgi:hypothetical protein